LTRPIKNADLLALPGTVVESQRHVGVRYRLEGVIGEGGQGVVFLALRESPAGDEEVVLKLLRPRALRDLPGLAAMAISKEVGALERLSARVPSSPFVVRLLDAGTLRIGDHSLELPWIAVEYVRGGPDGTTLRSRVAASVAETGAAFDVRRARSVTECMTAGLTAIHEVGVIHRDVNPGNVLCSGAGETESFKISDFGLARVSSASTYGNVLLGTPGYCSPEQSFPEKVGVGPYSDVFGLACTLYFVLTGEPYFVAPTIPETLVAVYNPDRRRILDARAVCAELRAQPEVCAELDGIFARATHTDPQMRPQSPAELGRIVLRLFARGLEQLFT
jgi:serine/threonine protein kinase